MALVCHSTASSNRPSALARLGLGLALMAQTDYGAAASELETVARLRPSRADVHRYLGITLIENKRIDEAIAHLSRAIELEPNCPVATLNLGIALRIKGDLVSAEASLVHAIELGPQCIDAYDELAATCGWLARICSTSVVPDRIIPTTNTGRVDSFPTSRNSANSSRR